MAVANDGDNRVMTSDNGINWTVENTDDNQNEWSSVAYGDGKFVAVAETGDRVMVLDFVEE